MFPQLTWQLTFTFHHLEVLYIFTAAKLSVSHLNLVDFQEFLKPRGKNRSNSLPKSWDPSCEISMRLQNYIQRENIIDMGLGIS